MIQLIGSWLAYDICLLFAYNRDRLSGLDACLVVAVLLHFFSLSTQLWTTVAAHCLILAANDDQPHSASASDNCSALCRRLLVAWGTSTQLH